MSTEGVPAARDFRKYGAPTPVRLPRAMLQELDREADRLGLTRSEFIRKALEAALCPAS